MLHSRHIVVADYPDGKTETVYQGADVIAAEATFQKVVAAGKAEAVVVFHQPLISRLRRPLQEAEEAKSAAAETERLAGLAATRKQDEALKKREMAKQLTADAKRLEAEASAHIKD